METFQANILVVDSEASTRQLIEKRLLKLGYNVFIASKNADIIQSLKRNLFSLILLDITSPNVDGHKIYRTIRGNSQVPIIIITSLGLIADHILGLELETDDFLVKPFATKELEARISFILRRYDNPIATSQNKKNKVVQIGSLIINLSKKQVFKRSLRLKLTGMEFNLLAVLLSNPGKRMSRTTLLDTVWGFKPKRYVDTRLVDVHISRLRAKLEDNPSNPTLIITARGTGYMFQQYEDVI